MLETLEYWIRFAGAIAGPLTLAIAIIEMLKSVHRPAGREEQGARFALRAPVLIIATILFIGAGALLWKPLPVVFSYKIRTILLILGAPLFFGGLILYLWGLHSLGKMFAPSSGFGVRLHSGHRLVTSGPYALMRHPMYLAVIMSAIGTFLIYQTWGALCFAIIMNGLFVRARREEKILAEEFGDEWKTYATKVPPWFPRMLKR